MIPSSAHTVTGSLASNKPLILAFEAAVSKFDVRNTGPSPLCVIGQGEVPPGGSRLVSGDLGWVESNGIGSSLALSAPGATSFSVTRVA